MSGLTDGEREVVCLCAEVVSVNAGIDDAYLEQLCDGHVDAVEQIIAARESAAVEAFRAKAVEWIESEIALQSRCSDASFNDGNDAEGAAYEQGEIVARRIGIAVRDLDTT